VTERRRGEGEGRGAWGGERKEGREGKDKSPAWSSQDLGSTVLADSRQSYCNNGTVFRTTM